MIADGQVVGVWKRTVKGQWMMVTLAPFAEVAVAGWQERMAEYGRFGGDAVKSFPSSIRLGDGLLVMGQR